jgi:hypothetical protein
LVPRASCSQFNQICAQYRIHNAFFCRKKKSRNAFFEFFLHAAAADPSIPREFANLIKVNKQEELLNKYGFARSSPLTIFCIVSNSSLSPPNQFHLCLFQGCQTHFSIYFSAHFVYRVGRENLPSWPTWHKKVHNYLSSEGILIKLLVNAVIYAGP